MDINSIIFQQADFGDYIFLILVVVASIIQAFTQNKKKKDFQKQSQQRMGQENGPAADAFDRTPETMKGYETPLDNIFDSVERTLIPELEDGKHTWGDDYAEFEEESDNTKDATFVSKSSVEPVIVPVAEKLPVPRSQKTATDIPAISYKSGIRNGFSLKKAVIYSEILNRKYT